MEIEKSLDALHSDIMCENKIYHYGENFFHNHDGYELFLLIEGDINFYIENTGQRLNRGNLVCIKPYDFHRRELIKTDTYKRIVINVKEAVLNNLSTKLTDLSVCFYRNLGGKINIIQLNENEIGQYLLFANRLSEELSSEEYGSDILVDTYIKQILVMVNHHYSTKQIIINKDITPPLVANTIAYIEQHLSEEITLSILSGQFHHNGTYISRCFKKVTGISLQQYIIAKKITLAQKYLREGYSPHDVCYQVGFNNYSNFSRTFTKESGLSPKKYQSQQYKA